MIQYVYDIKDYCDKFTAFSSTKQVPIFIKNRDDIVRIKNKIPLLYRLKKEKKSKCTFIFLDYSIEFLKTALFHLVENGIFKNIDDVCLSELSGDVCIVGYYSDYNISKLEEFQTLSFQGNFKLQYLIGRDITSLTWLIAKQFFVSDIKKHLIILGNGMQIEEYRTAKSLENENIRVLTVKDLKDPLIINRIENNFYKTIIFYSHGKDDHINLYHYTLCGKSFNADSIDSSYNSPVCNNGTCFKDDNKLISISNLCCEKLILASCHSNTYRDASNYNVNYNLTMTAVDSLAKNIIAASSATRFGIRELLVIGDVETQNTDIIKEINTSLKDVQPIPLYNMIGLDDENKWLTFNEPKINYQTTIDSWLDIILNAEYLVCSNAFYGYKDLISEIYSILRDCLLYSCKNKIVLKNSKKILKNVKEKIVKFEKNIADIFCENYFLLGDMSSWFLETMDANSAVEVGQCHCHNKLFCYDIRDKFLHCNNLKELFCYECGDKGFILGNNIIHISNSFNVYNNTTLISNNEIKFKTDSKVVCGITLPNYLRRYIKSIDEVKLFETLKNQLHIISFKIEFNGYIPKQKHYFAVYFMQDLSIYFERFVFEIV